MKRQHASFIRCLQPSPVLHVSATGEKLEIATARVRRAPRQRKYHVVVPFQNVPVCLSCQSATLSAVLNREADIARTSERACIGHDRFERQDAPRSTDTTGSVMPYAEDSLIRVRSSIVCEKIQSLPSDSSLLQSTLFAFWPSELAPHLADTPAASPGRVCSYERLDESFGLFRSNGPQARYCGHDEWPRIDLKFADLNECRSRLSHQSVLPNAQNEVAAA